MDARVRKAGTGETAIFEEDTSLRQRNEFITGACAPWTPESRAQRAQVWANGDESDTESPDLVLYLAMRPATACSTGSPSPPAPCPH